MNRRQIILSGIGTFAYYMSPKTGYANTAGTVFALTWGGIEVGYSKINLVKSGSNTIANIEVDIAVKILNFDAFNYKLRNTEIWKKNKLVKIEAETKVGKKTDYVNGKATKQGFEIDGSGFSGLVKGNLATTSYFSPDFLRRKIWISTQNGDPLKKKKKKIGTDQAKTKNGTIPAVLWRITGDIDLDLLYGENGQWLGSRFKAGGANAEFVLMNNVGNIDTVWKS